MTATVGDVTIAYRNFIQSVVDILFVAISVFIAVKLINDARDRIAPPAQSVPDDQPEKPSEQDLLIEIRDLLKARQ